MTNKYIFLTILSFISMVYCRNYIHIKNNDILYPMSYTYVSPKSYVCICTPSYLVGEIKNISDWDGECSNNQVCYWNRNEVIIKTWYNP